jgi:ABC-type amino acid transport substrate-binding protein
MKDVFVQGVGDLEYKPALAVTPVDVSQDLIEKNNRVPQIDVAGSYQEAFDALTARGVYAVVGDEYALTLMANADDRIDVIDVRYRPNDYVIALPRFDADFLDLVNYILQDMFLDGTLDRLQQQYFGPYLPEGSKLEDITLEIWPGDDSYLRVGG